VAWRTECFDRARAKTFVEQGKTLGTKGLHHFFFTEEASDDYLRMLVVIPQYVMSYTKMRDEKDSWRFVIPRRITQDFLENRYGDIKLSVGHNGLTASNVLPVANDLEMNQVQNNSMRLSKRKRNTGTAGADQGDGEKPARSVSSRFKPYEEMAECRMTRKIKRDELLESSGYNAAFKVYKITVLNESAVWNNDQAVAGPPPSSIVASRASETPYTHPIHQPTLVSVFTNPPA
jgi:hypothetical protein